MTNVLEKRKPLANGSVCVFGQSYSGVLTPLEPIVRSVNSLANELGASILVASSPVESSDLAGDRNSTASLLGQTFCITSALKFDLIRKHLPRGTEEVIFVIVDPKLVPNIRREKSIKSAISEFASSDPFFKIKSLPENFECICLFYGPPHEDLEFFLRQSFESKVRKNFERP